MRDHAFVINYIEATSEHAHFGVLHKCADIADPAPLGRTSYARYKQPILAYMKV